MDITLKHWTILGGAGLFAAALLALCLTPLNTSAQAAPSEPAAVSSPLPSSLMASDMVTFSESGVIIAEIIMDPHSASCKNMPLVFEGVGKRVIWEKSIDVPTETLILMGYVAAGTPITLNEECEIITDTDGLHQGWACGGAAGEDPVCLYISATLTTLPACNEGCGICQCSAGQAADPVDTRSGAFSRRETDFSLPTLGPDLTFERVYNSERYADLGPLGYGWSHPYAVSLEVTATHVLFHAPRGSVLTYTRTSSNTFLASPNVRAELGAVGETYILTTTDRERYVFDATGRLAELRDANDNVLTLTYAGGNLTGIHDAAGRGLALSYTDFAAGPGVTTTLLTRVTDPLGRSVGYGYAREGAYTTPLLSVLTDTRGFTHTYTYAGTPAPLLLSATNAAGQPIFINEYGPGFDAAHPNAVVVQTDTVGSATRMQYTTGEDTYVTTITDARGHSTQQIYDAAGVLVRTVDAGGAIWGTRRDLYVNPSQATDPLSRTTRAEWTANGCAPAIVTDALGHTTHISYNAACRPTQLVDAQGYTTTYQYDGENLVGVTDAANGATTHTYDARGLLLQTVDHGLTTTYGYDVFGQRVAITDTQGRVTTYGYDAAGRLVATTAPNGLATVNVYDAGDHLVQVTRNFTTFGGQNYLDTYNLVTQYEYDALGNPIAVTDMVGRATRSWYDPAGRLLRTATNDAPPVTASYGYDALGNQMAMTDTVGRVTRRWYDAQNRLIRVTANYSPALAPNYNDEWNLTTEYGYDLVGNQTRVTDTLGNVTLTEYDDLNRQIAVIDPLGNVTRYDYDSLGRQTVVTDADGIATHSDYDALGRVTATRDALGNVTRYTYDEQGRQSTVTDANGVARRSEYDALGRLLGNIANYVPEAPPDFQTNVRTGYGYDELGRREVVTDAASSEMTSGHATRAVYDVTGRLIAEIDPLGNTTRYGYDVLGNRAIITAADGSVTTYDYDTRSRLIEIRYPDATVAYAYDVLGNRTMMTDSTGITTYAYDARSRIITVTSPTTGTVGYRYDALGRRTAIVYPSGDTARYTYDAAGRQRTVTDWSDGVTVYTYTAAGRLAERRLPNGVTSRWRYDGAGRLVELLHRNAAEEVLSRYRYTLDALGNRIQIQEGALYQIYLPLVLRAGGTVARAGETAANQETAAAAARLISYRYDPLNRLVAADYSTGEHFAYRYDAAGNRLILTETTPLSGTVVSHNTYDAANRLAAQNVSDGRAYTYTWSARGQLLAEYTHGIPVRTFDYNGAGQMAEATVFTLTTQFGYNGLGGRVSVDVLGYGATQVTLDAAGGQRILAETTSTGAVQYLYGDDCLGEYRDGEPALSAAEGWLYYLNDGAGYVRQSVDGQGVVAGSWLFDPSGVVLEGPEGPVSHLICGGVYDWSTGLLYKGGGYFDPRLGVWLLLAPLVIAQGWSRKRKKYSWMILIFLTVSIGGTLAAFKQPPAISHVCLPPNTPTPGAPPEQVFEGYHLILACGLDTDCPGKVCDSRYQSMVPLQRIRDGFVDRGGSYTYLGDGTALSDTSVYANQIVTEIGLHSESKGVFLVGHSRGATAAIWASSISSNPQLKAIAILDSYLLENDHDRCKSGEYHGCVSDGQKVMAATPMFMGKSDWGGQYIRFPIDTSNVPKYPVASHEDLAANESVANLIIDFFANNRW